MALIKCPECGIEVSDKAKSCPRCGYPIAEEEGGEFDIPGWKKYLEGKSPEQIEEIKKRLGGKAKEELKAKKAKQGLELGSPGCFGCLGLIAVAVIFVTALIGDLFTPGDKPERIFGVHGEVKQIGTIMLQVPVNPRMTDGQFEEAAEKIARKYGLEEYAKIDMRNYWNGKRVRMYEVKNGMATRVYHW